MVDSEMTDKAERLGRATDCDAQMEVAELWDPLARCRQANDIYARLDATNAVVLRQHFQPHWSFWMIPTSQSWSCVEMQVKYLQAFMKKPALRRKPSVLSGIQD